MARQIHPLTSSLRRATVALAVSGSALVLSSCGGGSTTLNGAGASFPASIYQRWFQELSSQGVRVNYQSVGSGAGVRQFMAGTVDFGATDVPMKAEEVSKVTKGVVQVPMTAGAIAVAYNHKGCDLKLNQGQLTDIFLGKIKDYSALGCAAKPIKVVFRSDGSGTTANFSAHLAAISPEWKNGPGQGKTLNWPTGVGAKGNEGVAAQLTKLDGGIGYVETAYVREPLQAAALTNASGQVLKPTPDAAATALASIDLGPDLIGSDPNPKAGYPIVSFSWILLYKTGNGTKLEGLQKVFDYTLSAKAQEGAGPLSYVPLPEAVLSLGRTAVQGLSK